MTQNKNPDKESGVIATAESLRERTMRLAKAFGLLSLASFAAGTATEAIDSNSVSAAQAMMGGYDGVLFGGSWLARRYDDQGRSRMASAVRRLLSGAHIAVAGAGAGSALERAAEDISASPTSIGVSAAVAITGLWSVWKDERDHMEDVARGELPEKDRNHQFMHRLLQTKIAESIAMAGGTGVYAATGDPRWGAAATVATFVGVDIPMGQQIVDG